jgi:hypothetical protein
MESTIEEIMSAETADCVCGEILTVKQVATRLQLKPSWVYAHADQLGAYRAGKYLRFHWLRVLERLERAPIEVSSQRTISSSSASAMRQKRT